MKNIEERKNNYKKLLEESKYYTHLERQKNLLNQKTSMSKTHMNMLKRFENELKTKKLNYIDRKVLEKVVNIMKTRLNNEELFLTEKLENFKNLRQEMKL